MKKLRESIWVIVIFIAFMAVILPGVTRAACTLPDICDKLGSINTKLGSTDTKLDSIDKKLGQYAPAPIPKTGQTSCFDSDGNQIPDCTGTGQDGEFQAGVAIPPTAQRFMVNEGTVKDNLTGLMWTQDAGVFANGLLNAVSACKSCSAGNYDDWRLPNVREIQSLLDYEEHSPALPAGHPFTNVCSYLTECYYHYWSSTNNYYSLGAAILMVEMDAGTVRIYSKFSGGYVLCVRGGL